MDIIFERKNGHYEIHYECTWWLICLCKIYMEYQCKLQIVSGQGVTKYARDIYIYI